MVFERMDRHSASDEHLLDFTISLDRHRLVIAIPVNSISPDVCDKADHFVDLIPPAPLQDKPSSGHGTGELI